MYKLKKLNVVKTVLSKEQAEALMDKGFILIEENPDTVTPTGAAGESSGEAAKKGGEGKSAGEKAAKGKPAAQPGA